MTGGAGEADGRAGPAPAAGAGSDEVPRSARRWVAFLLVALLTPGLIGFELWPMTAWRMFSLPRGDTSSRWVLEGVAEDGSTRLVGLGELPVEYSNAEWPMRSVGSGSEERREEICRALADAVGDADPRIVEVRVARDEQALVREEGEWTVRHDLDVRHSCLVDPETGQEVGAP